MIYIIIGFVETLQFKLHRVHCTEPVLPTTMTGHASMHAPINKNRDARLWSLCFIDSLFISVVVCVCVYGVSVGALCVYNIYILFQCLRKCVHTRKNVVHIDTNE